MNRQFISCFVNRLNTSVSIITRLQSFATFLIVLFLIILPAPARGDTPVVLYESIAGNINVTGTGGTLRSAADPTSCTVVNNGTMTLSGIPAGATVRKAYLYWAGSGGDPAGGVGPDYNVTFNGTPVTADRTYTAWYNVGGGNVLYFFGGTKDVTTQVTANGVYTFSNLTVQNADVAGGGQYCTSAAVLSAFSLVVVYDDPTEILHVVNIWEGFQTFRGSSITLSPTNFKVPTPAPVTALSSRILILTWEGDSGNSTALGGFNENLTFCSPTPCAGTALTDAYNPANNQFNSTVDMPPSGPFSGINTTWGLDLDMYDITNKVPAGAASAQSVYSSGADLVILANQTMSIPNVPVADLAITKTHTGNFAVGMNGLYTLTVTNNGPKDVTTTDTITVKDTLPAGLTYVSGTGTGWTCSAAGQIVTCTRTGSLLANGATAPSIALVVAVGAAASPSVTNAATVSSTLFDNIASNNTSTNITTVQQPPNIMVLKSAQILSDPVTGVTPSAKAIPGAVMQYTVTVTNAGTGIADSDSIIITDPVPANTTMYVDAAGSAVTFSCSAAPPCGLTWTYANAVSYSYTAGGGPPYVYPPTAIGYDPLVKGVRIKPSGTLKGGGASFTLQFKVQIN